MNNSLTRVDPVSPIAPWIGGKRNLAKRLCAIIDTTPCTTYAEPFVGMGGIFLRRSSRPRAEVINDAGRDVANLFRILQRHYPSFLQEMRFQLTTRFEFDRLVITDPETLTDLEPMLEDLHARLAGVVIECLDFGEFIRRYDRPGTLFYLNPPYWGSESDYGQALFSRQDFQRLSDILTGIAGAFILSINDVPEIRQVFSWARIEEVSTSYTIGRKTSSRGERPELVIRGGASGCSARVAPSEI